MSIRLEQILDLVGTLDDAPGDDSPRERFRRFLRENVRDIAQLRDHLDECLRSTGDQYSRALQDLVNHLGTFLGFDVTCGRYKGARGQLGFDGHWVSPTKFHVIVEVKTTVAYSVKVSTLLGYVNDLISEGHVPSWDQALGLYVVGRPDPELRQLEDSIIAQKRTSALRVVSVDALLSLGELLQDYDAYHEDILAVLRPSGPRLDPVIDLLARVAAASPPAAVTGPGGAPDDGTRPSPTDSRYWLTPVRGTEDEPPEGVVKRLAVDTGIYAWSERTPGRKRLKPGDWICFYGTGTGVVGHARVVSRPVEEAHPAVRDAERYCWVFEVDEVAFHPDAPVVIDAALRGRLAAFRGRDPESSWSWFVQGTHEVAASDFAILTGRA
jgi:hypothetical protein